MTNPITTIGIDSSLTNIGVVFRTTKDDLAVYADHLILPKKLRGAERLGYILKSMSSVLDTQSASLAVIEGYNYQGHNLAQLGEAAGILKALCALRGVTVLEASPLSIKKFATGNSQATKKMMMERYGITNEHVADARAMSHLAYTFLTNRSNIRHELEVIKNLKMGPKKNKEKKIFRIKDGTVAL